MQDFEGKTAVITGGASGMGFAFAETFAREGMNIVLADIEEKALRDAGARIEAHGASVLLVQTDVSDEAQMDHLAEVTKETFGVPDIICLNAGVSGGGGPMQDLTTNDWKWCLGVNLWGIIHGIRVFLKDMVERDSGQVVITASVAGLTSYPNMAPYNASKHSAVTIAETLASEFAESGSNVRVSCLCPGIVSTGIVNSERNRPKELENEEVNEASEELHEFMKATFAEAKPAAEVAELLLAAIVEGRFWVQTDEYFREPIRERHRAIETDSPPPARGTILNPYMAD
jgi:NAD(P)-dependent dehydrogenase (short-subunit alcohol dehydrogenase family)